MPFDDEILAGKTLIRDAIQSRGYDAGANPRWAIRRDGTADLQGANFRGDITFESTLGTPPLWNAPVAPARIFNDFGEIMFQGPLEAGQPANGYAYVLLLPNGAMQTGSTQLIFARATGVTPGQFGDYAAFNMPLIARGDDSASDPPLNVDGGNLTVTAASIDNLALVLARNQIQALNNGVASPLYLNWSTAGAVNIGTGGLSVNGNVDGNSATLSSFTISAGVLSNTAGTQLGTNVVLPGGQVNCTNPPSGAGPGAGTAWWNNTAGTNYRLSRTTSSRRYKENVRDLDVYAVDQLLALKPRWYQRNDSRDYTDPDEPLIPVTEDTPWVPGFIAEEADELGLRSWVAYDAEDRPDSFGYGEFAAVAHQVVLREHQRLIADLTAKVADLERRLANV